MAEEVNQSEKGDSQTEIPPQCASCRKFLVRDDNHPLKNQTQQEP